MSWSSYASFLVFAVVLVLVPGPDFAVVTKNTLAGGRRRGVWTSIGVTSSNFAQGAAAATGLGALIVRAQPVFEALRWAGLGYLLVLAIQSFRSAIAGEYALPGGRRSAVHRGAVAGWRQGFLSNITNPKVLVFYLAVLPQFLGAHPTLIALFALALTHAVLSLIYLTLLVGGMHRAREVLARRRVRRSLDVATGAASLGFGVKLAVD
ncbi:MAG: LysE family translocator [Mycobacterium sp.]|nr:LysE family translocator [Mycobacterium sp.]